MLRYFIVTSLLILLLLAGSKPAIAGKTVTAGLEQNPPLSYLDREGRPAGVLVDVLKEIAEKEKWELVFVPGTLAEGLERLNQGSIDLFITLAYSEERAKTIDFNKDNVVVNWGQIYTAKGKAVRSFLDLEGKTIAVVAKDTHHQALRTMIARFGVRARYLEVKNFDEVFQSLVRGSAEVGVVGRFYGMTHEQDGVTASQVVFNPIEVRYAFPKGKSQELIGAIDRRFAAMREEPGSAYHVALERHLQVPGGVGFPRWAKLLVGAILCLLPIALATNWYLRLEVRRRTRALEEENEERRRVERSLANSERKYRELVQGANTIILKLDTGGRITFVNEYAQCFFGYAEDELVGKHVVGTIVPPLESSGRNLEEYIESLVHHPDRFPVHENENMKKDGSTAWIRWSNRPLFDADGVPAGLLCIGQDVSERKEYEKQLLHQANHDPLTGLPNRKLLQERLERAIAVHDGKRFEISLILLDLDNFKMVNDTLGHAAGDLLLVTFADRMRGVLRDSDVLARLSGDEFVILPGRGNGEGAVAGLAERVLEEVKAPFRICDQEIYLTVSLGIVTYPQDGETVEVLLQHADAAMYAAKREGKNDFRFFMEGMNTNKHDRLHLETSLHKAFENGEFVLFYQPQARLDTLEVTGAEVLLRWEKPGGETVLPHGFIRALEDSGLIVPVSEWILDCACKRTKSWLDRLDRDFLVSVNISAKLFHRADIVETIGKVLARYDFPPRCLQLELTESLLMSNTEATLAKLHQLKDMGVSLSIDDFGTGYSSLSYLNTLPIRELKIDRSFVSNIGSGPGKGVLVKTIISMARSLNLHVVAEGVETQRQRDFLLLHRCPAFQGHLLSPAIPADQMELMLRLPDGRLTGQPLAAQEAISV